MKSLALVTFLTLLLSCAAAPVAAADRQAEGLVRAEDLIGLQLVNSAGDKLGTLQEILIDPTSRHVLLALVAVEDDPSDAGEGLRAVPFPTLKFRVDAGTALLGASRYTWSRKDAAAPKDPAGGISEEQARAIFEHYGLPWERFVLDRSPWLTRDQVVAGARPPLAGALERLIPLASVTGTGVSGNGEISGTLGDYLIDLKKDRIAFALITEIASPADLADASFIVPAENLESTSEGTFRLDPLLDAAALRQAPEVAEWDLNASGLAHAGVFRLPEQGTARRPYAGRVPSPELPGDRER